MPVPSLTTFASVFVVIYWPIFLTVSRMCDLFRRELLYLVALGRDRMSWGLIYMPDWFRRMMS
jgi:hypothetical protein